jgi:hypothetical protein
MITTNKDRFSRRALLRTMGLSAGLLPLISTEKAVGAGPNGFPKRLVLTTWTNGVIKNSFYPAAPGELGTLGATLAPLQPYAKKMLIPMGLGINVATYAGHFSWGAIWTGQAKGRTGQGPSIDQTISDAIGKKAQLTIPLMNTGVRCIGDGQPSSWRSAGLKNVPEIDPVRLYNRMFTGASLPMGMVDNTRERRKSILDFVGAELDAFAKRLGPEDREKIEAHQVSLRDIEKQLSAPSAATACAKPAAPANPKLDTPTMMKTMYDLMAIALRCDITRVATIDIYDDGGGDGNSFPWLGINRDYHAVAHGGGGSAADKIKIDSWLFTNVANLVKQLDDTKEGDGTMLDNSLILSGNGMEDGTSHRVGPIPFLMIGSAGGYFKTGRAVQYMNGAHNKLLATVCNAFDIPVTSYGAAGKEGTLPELTMA